MTEVYAQIASWALMRLQEPGRPSSFHLVGYIVTHGRFVEDAGEPYLGSTLAEIDLQRRVAVNWRGRRIALVGDPLPAGNLPEDIQAVIAESAVAWQLPAETIWERVELSSLFGGQGAG